ncbi:MAG: FGGY-family carbohydrate kinase [Candidatus Hodarchaeota archaeon]
MTNQYILSHDLGTTGNKAVLFDLNLNVIHHLKVTYPLYYPKEGWAEQEPEDYWNAIKVSTREIFQKTNLDIKDIIAIVFDCQMNCTIPIDQEGNTLMRSISWVDTRASIIAKKYKKGLIKIAGYGLSQILMFIKITGGAPGLNGKDPISHILWIKEHQPEIYRKTYKFLSVKDFIIYKCTQKAVTSRDLGHTSWMMDTNPNKFFWSDKILDRFEIDKNKLPEIKRSVEKAGNLTKDAAEMLGLEANVPVFVGSGDLTSAAIGSGAIIDNQPVICLGTSDWIAAHTSKRLKDLTHYMGIICSSQDNYLCISKQETGATCLDWIINQMFKDQADTYKINPSQLYDYIDSTVLASPVGAKRLLFTPWMFGERSPINKSNVRAGFYNLSLNHTREDLLRAIYEGVGYNIKWALQFLEKLIGKNDKMHIIGGGAKSDVWCQIISDILNKEITQMEDPDLAAAKGSAIVAMIGLGILNSFSDAIRLIKIQKEYKPNPNNIKIYQKLFAEYKKLYERNKAMFEHLNS